MTIENFLDKVKDAYPHCDPHDLWEQAKREIQEKYCAVSLLDGGVCNLEKIEGVCPYHKGQEVDFMRRCGFMTNRGASCRILLKTRDLKEIWCAYHLNVPKNNFKLMRISEYIVIKDTPYAISDDMLCIIGRVEATYMLTFELKRERDPLMEEVAKTYGLNIRLEDEN